MPTRRSFVAPFAAAALAVTCAIAVANAQGNAAASDGVEPGRFVWRDLLTKDVAAARRFYGELFGWRFENTKRGDRPYVLARSGSMPIAGIVDISDMAEAGSQWLSFLSVADVDKSVALVQAERGKVLIEPRDLPLARVAIVTDPQGAPIGLAKFRRGVPEPDPSKLSQNEFFWQEYLARDAAQALAFYKRLAGYESVLQESKLEVDYHVLRTTRGRAGLFQLPPKSVDVQPNWLPYLLVSDPAAAAGRVAALGGTVVLPAAPERRNGTLVVISDPSGAVVALQKYPF
jgi:predicted enzyme related to lactoylglutathione lyase